MKVSSISATNGIRHVIRDAEGRFIDNLPLDPDLNTIRERSRKNGGVLDRIDILDGDFKCSNCSEIISDRFGSDSSGKILCWSCAMHQSPSNDLRKVTQSSDPTKAAISKSGLKHKNLCDYVINVATGCTHGCKFCYVPSTPNIKMRGDMLNEQAEVEDGQKEWGSYVLYRDDLPERLGRKLDRKRTWNRSPKGRGVVMISSGTDCYQDRRTAQITRGCVIELVKHDRPVRILTRSPAVARDIDIFKAAEGLVTVGSSIPCLDDEQVRSIEPGAPVPSARLDALEKISDEGIPVYVSMSPTYPTQNCDDLRNLLRTFKERLDPDVVFHEPINPRGANFEMTVQAARNASQNRLADKLSSLRNRETWVEYSLNHLMAVEEIGREIGVPIHLWPDKQLIQHLDDEPKEHLQRERDRIQTPESYPRTPALS